MIGSIKIFRVVVTELARRMSGIRLSSHSVILLVVSAICLLTPLSIHADTYRWIPVENYVYSWDNYQYWWTDSDGGHYGLPVFGDTVIIRRFYQSEHTHWGPSPYTINITADSRLRTVSRR